MLYYCARFTMANWAGAPSPFNLLFDPSVLKFEVEGHTLFLKGIMSLTGNISINLLAVLLLFVTVSCIEFLRYTSSEKVLQALASGTSQMYVVQTTCAILCQSHPECEIFAWNNGVCELKAAASLAINRNGIGDIKDPKIHYVPKTILKKSKYTALMFSYYWTFFVPDAFKLFMWDPN